jgi:hypothetical protein
MTTFPAIATLYLVVQTDKPLIFGAGLTPEEAWADAESVTGDASREGLHLVYAQAAVHVPSAAVDADTPWTPIEPWTPLEEDTIRLGAEMSHEAFFALLRGIRLNAAEILDYERGTRGVGQWGDPAFWAGRGRVLLEAATALGWGHVIEQELGEIPESWKPEVPA